MEALLEVTGMLAGAMSADAVARAIIVNGVPALGASTGALWIVDRPKQQLQLVGVSAVARGSIERWTTIPLDADVPLVDCVRSVEPIFVDSLADYRARYPQSFERIKGTVTSDDVTYALLPIVDGEPVRGALAVTYDHAHALGPSDRTFLMIIARQCALALSRIELHEAERAARLDAEEATRAREEILSVVSHDLRNPLGTILMGVGTLQQIVEPGDPKSDRIRTIAERIQRQSDRMARLIEDLVDFAGIQAGRLSIERRPIQPEAIVAATSELLALTAQERGIGFSVDVAPNLPTIEVDPDRAIQVLSNLLANAIKVTTKGARVSIGAQGDGEVVFFVRDSGPGIEADELPRLFERYWRSKKATYKGAGLGLSIARGIVEAHHGRIWAESQVGVGTTFFFTLAPRP